MAIRIQIKKKLDAFDLCLDVETKSRRIGILGESGCGKSMTLKCIAGIVSPDEGEVWVDGETLFDSAAGISRKTRERKVGYLFQNYALFPTMTVRENIMAGMKKPKRERQKAADELIAKFSLTGLESRLPGQLSGGQQQRTALARMLAAEPKAILLDEPFSALDSCLKEQMQLELACLLEEYEGTVILVSHSREEVYRFSEEVIVMDKGRQIEMGKTKKVFAHPVTKEGARLTGCRNISRVERAGEGRIMATDWNLEFAVDAPLAEDIRYIGIPAEALKIRETKEEDCHSMRLVHQAELPDCTQYWLLADGGSKEVCIKAGKDTKILKKQVFVSFPKEKLLLLC